jgi:hypothetical protein
MYTPRNLRLVGRVRRQSTILVLVPLLATFAACSGDDDASTDSSLDATNDSGGADTFDADPSDGLDDALDADDRSDSLTDVARDAAADSDAGAFDVADTAPGDADVAADVDPDSADTDTGSGGPDAPIAFLPGPSDADATDSMVDIGPFVADEADRDGVFLRRRISAVIAEGVTVGEFNAALAERGAELAGAIAGTPFVSLQVPPMDNYEAALERCDELVDTGVFAAAYPATMFVPEPVVSGGSESKSTGGSGTAYWHETMRTYAAWNGASLLAEPTTVLVADTWAQISSHPDISAQRFAPGASAVTATASDGTAVGNHGFWVAGILGADVDSDGTAGTALRASTTLDVLSAQVGGMSFLDVLIAIERAAVPTSGRLVLNTSFGYNDPGELIEKRDARALYALAARSMLQRLGPDRVFVLAAAGNDGTVAGVTAELSSPFATQALVADLSTLIEPAGQAAWSVIEARATNLANKRQVVGNTLVVGASRFAGVRASFSTPGHDVLLPGEAISGPCVVAGGRCDGTEQIDNGTSAATPLASGLAAMAWSIAPTLDAAEIRALLLRSAGEASIDAFDVLLGAAAAAEIDPLLAIADADDDGDIDDDDIATCISEWSANESATPDPLSATRDWQRCDLNGDGYSRTDIGASVDLDADDIFDVITVDVDGVDADFGEESLTDFDVLCLAMYGPLFAGDSNVRDEELAAFCSGDELLPSPDAVWVGTIVTTREISEVSQYFRCLENEEQSAVTATLDVECNGSVPGAGGECHVVRLRGAMNYYRGSDPQLLGETFGGTGVCGAGGTCGEGHCYEDLDCACAHEMFCTAEGFCARGRVTVTSKNDYRASGPIRGGLTGPVLSFDVAGAGTVSGSLQAVSIEADGVGGRLVSGFSVSGTVTAEEQAGAELTYASAMGPFVASAFILSPLSTSDARFAGTISGDTITGEWSDSLSYPIGSNGSFVGSETATISLRRIR